MVAKYIEVSRSIQSRIEHGDYFNKVLPSERKLAQEQCVSYMTARRAIAYLIDNGVLERNAEGRIVQAGEFAEESRSKVFAFMAPACVSLLNQEWYVVLEHALSGHNCLLRPINFVHWEDSVVLDSIERYDGVFLLPTLEPVPERVVENIREKGKPVVCLEIDWSENGFVSIIPRQRESISLLCEHLLQVGSARIDCLNTQNTDRTISSAIDCWRGCIKSLGVEGELYNAPVAPYGDSMAMAYDYTSRMIQDGNWDTTALLCLTLSASMGVMRAMLDNGLTPGRDTKICSVNGVGHARYLNPSLTTIEDPLIAPIVSKVVSWLLEGGDEKGLSDGLKVYFPKPRLFIGESTSL